MNQSLRANRLSNESSLYLRQHAENPVDWFPWGPEAFERARERDVPILLSVGYSSCHWCHVMAHESFEDEETARLLNASVVSVKLDREERPDVDALYMAVCQAMTGGGGWPLTVLLTPDLKPFFAGTYFPKRAIPGRPAFTDILRNAVEFWRSHRDDVEQTAQGVLEWLQAQELTPGGEGGGMGPEVHVRALDYYMEQFDDRYGGFGGAPKFPSGHNLSYLARRAGAMGRGQLVDAVLFTLDRMVEGGIWDQLGGGLHRYSVDRQWRVPHFEKMLYDQALLVLAMCDAEALSPGRYGEAVSETLSFVGRELTSRLGAFYAALDADSEGEEGRYYTWTLGEIVAAVDSELVPRVKAHFDMEGRGPDLEGGRYVLAGRGRMSGERPKLAAEVLERLKAVRDTRVRPGRDDKVLTDWNGLMIAAFARASKVYGNDEYLVVARRAMDVMVAERVGLDGRLSHCFAGGGRAVDGMLDDYAFLVWGMLELYEAETSAGNDAQWLLRKAEQIFTYSAEWLLDEAAGVFVSSHKEAADILVRQRPLYDGALPSGNSVQLHNAQRLHELTGSEATGKVANSLVTGFADLVVRSPWAFAHFLSALA